MDDLTNQLLIGAILIGALSTLLVGGLLYFRAHREAHYNVEKHRAELEMLRESFEGQIYKLTDRLMSTEDRWSDLNHLLISRLKTQPDTVEPGPAVPITRFLKSYGISETETDVDPRLVFVLTPFNKQFQNSFDTIAETCREVGLHCLRGDEEQVRGDLLPHIIRLIIKARVIVANIDGRNPNVFYELGIAHTLDKVTILVTKSVKSAPFDLKAKKLVVYKDMDELRRGLQKELTRSLLVKTYPPDVEIKPITDRRLRIVIAGVPPGVNVGVFDERKEEGDEARPILLEEASSSNYVVETKVDPSYGGVPIKVVIRAAGFLPIEFEDTIDEAKGLFHAARLEVDRIYTGNKSEVPPGWDTEAEHRKAQKVIQDRPRTEVVSYEEWRHWPEVDLPTAAAIWSGSWDPGNAHRHVCFRNLKWAIRHDHLSAHRLNGDRPNIKTTVTPADLKEFLDHWDEIRRPQRPEDPRLNLSQLRTEGVEIRNNAGALAASDFCSQAGEWANETVYQIENIDPPDAEWFKTLDAVPPPRVAPPSGLSGEALKCFGELDFGLTKLEELIRKYGGK